MGTQGVITRLADAPEGALADLPVSAGVAQVLGADDEPLVTARAANLRRWAQAHLGPPKPAKPGRRPPTDLRPLARAVRHAVTSSTFNQRLVFERWMAETVPLSKRRDLKAPFFLHLDPEERFPRATLRPDAGVAGARVFGPFRDRGAAEKALKPLHKLFPLRPCDYTFEPDPALPLGLNCIYAQVKTCAAPCLERTSEDDYRALARRAAAFLADPRARPAESAAWLPAWAAAADATALVVEPARLGIELYPVRAGAVTEEGMARADSPDALEAAVAALRWDGAPQGRDDRPWLMAYLGAPKPRAAYLVVSDPADRAGLAARVRTLGAPGQAGPVVDTPPSLR